VTGHAESAPESGGLADLASFLDTPEEESNEEIEAQADDETLDEDNSDEANDEQDIDPESPDSEDEPAPVDKITFKVKGEDGSEETVEATTEEIAKSYMRQKDYTLKTQALAERENQAVQFLTTKHEEIRANYLQQAEVQRAAIVQMAGIKSDDEMAQLANSDPAAWVAENQRQRQVANFLSQLDQQISGEKQKAQAEAAQRQQADQAKRYEKAWTDLSKDGIDKPKLKNIFEQSSKLYGFSDAELAEVYDARMVRVLRDAAAYRDLQSKRQEVTKKVADAPRMPSKQTNPARERRDQALEQRFKSGRAKLNDLVAYMR
jgi:hypothetical protein